MSSAASSASSSKRADGHQWLSCTKALFALCGAGATIAAGGLIEFRTWYPILTGAAVERDVVAVKESEANADAGSEGSLVSNLVFNRPSEEDDDEKNVSWLRQGLDAARPVAWYHCPKCGTSFINVFLHSELCPRWNKTRYIASEQQLKGRHGEGILPKYCHGSFALAFRIKHSPFRQYLLRTLGPNRSRFKDQPDRNVMGFFRQPEQRMLSHYYYFVVKMRMLPELEGRPKRKVPSLLEYAPNITGCMTRLLAGYHSRLKGGNSRPVDRKPACLQGPGGTSEDVIRLAIHFIRTRFVFIGITEFWAESVCLFHLQFGGRCCPDRGEFINTRPTGSTDRRRPKKDATSLSNVSSVAGGGGGGPQTQDYSSLFSSKSSTHMYNTTPLEGYVDHADRRIYEAALERFNLHKKELGLTPEVCRQLCSSPCGGEADDGA